MTITSGVLSDLFVDGQQPVRITSSTPLMGSRGIATRNYLTLDDLRKRRKNLWQAEEHERFLEGLEMFPKGPWRLIAEHVGTKSTRQTMTHAQKYRQKIVRRRKRAMLDRKAREAHQQPQSPVSTDEPLFLSLSTPSVATSITDAQATPHSVTVDALSDVALLEFLDDFEPLDLASELVSASASCGIDATGERVNFVWPGVGHIDATPWPPVHSVSDAFLDL